MEIMKLTIALILVAATCFADGPFGNVPGQPVKPLPHYTPINPPRVKHGKSKVSDSVIFNSLKTPAKNGTKFVAGLTCTASKCSLTEKGSKEHDDYSIYVALTMKPKDVTSPLISGSKTFQKQAGRLTCTETVTKPAKSSKSIAS
jgi:hypothetical protein